MVNHNNDLSDCFTSTADYRPYTCLPVDPSVFDPERAKDPKDPNDPDYGKARKLPSIPMDADDDMQSILREGHAETGAPGPVP